MLKLYVRIQDAVESAKNVHRKEEAQDGFEYLLVIGIVVVAIIGGMVSFPGLIDTVETSVTNAVTGLF